MKKIFLILLFLLLTVNANATLNNLWPAAAEAIWVDMWNDSPEHRFKTNLTTYQASLDDANNGTRYAIKYQMTGSSADAEAAYSRWTTDCYQDVQSGAYANKLRDAYISCVINFSMFGDAISATNKTEGLARLRYMYDQVTSTTWYHGLLDPGDSCGDTDQCMGTYFGAMVHAAMLQNENPTFYTEVMTELGMQSGPYANIVHSKLSNWLDGTWVEGANYNLSTLNKYIVVATKVLAEYYGTDYYPEVTALYDEIADYLIQSITPDISTRYHWGDQESSNLGLFNRRMIPSLAHIAYADNDAVARYLFSTIWGTSLQNEDSWFLFADDKSTMTAPSGVMSHNSAKQGTTFWREGWSSDACGSDCSFSIIQQRGNSQFDHTSESCRTFELYNNGWILRTPAGTIEDPPYLACQYQNALLINGIFPLKWSEARAQVAYKLGSNYTYNAWTAGGKQFYSGSPTEHLKEHTSSIVYRHNADDSDTFIIFDRLKALDPRNVSNYTSYNVNWRSYLEGSTADINSDSIITTDERAATKWVIWADTDPTRSGDRITWTGNGENVFFDTKMSGYVYTEALAPALGGTGFTATSPFTTDYRVVLALATTDNFQTLLNFVHAGSAPTTSKILGTSNDAVVGAYYVAGSEKVLAIFSAIEPTYSPPTSGTGINSSKIDLIKNLRLITTGYTIPIAVTGNIITFFADLDPTQSWAYNVNGGAEVAISGVDTASQMGVNTVAMVSGVLNVFPTGVPPTDVCDSSHCTLCNQSNCVSASCNIWYDTSCSQGFGNYASCQSTTQSAACSSSNLGLCCQSQCSAIGKNWCDDDGNSVFECQTAACTTEEEEPSEFTFEADTGCFEMHNFSQTSGTVTDICSADAVSDAGTVAGNPVRSSGSVYVFDGTGDYISVADSAENDFSTGAWSMCTKVLFQSTSGTQTIFQKGNGGTSGVRYSMFLSGGTLFGSYDDDVTLRQISSSLQPNTTDYYYLCLVRNNTTDTLAIYNNAVSIGAVVITDADDISGQNSRALNIGAYCDSGSCPSSTPFNPFMTMDDFFIFNRALSTTEQQTWINNGGIDETGDTPVDPNPTVIKVQGTGQSGAGSF